MINFDVIRRIAFLKEEVEQQTEPNPVDTLVQSAQIVGDQSQAKLNNAQQIKSQAQQTAFEAQKKQQDIIKAQERVQKLEDESKQLQSQAQELDQAANDQLKTAQAEQTLSNSVIGALQQNSNQKEE